MPPAARGHHAARAAAARIVTALAFALVALALALFAWREYRVATILMAVRDDIGVARLERALDRLAEATSLAPLDASVHAEIGSVQGMRVRWRNDPAAESAAIAAYERAIDLSPRDAEFRAEYGWLLMRLGMPEAAERVFRDALALDPHNVYYLSSLARSFEAQGLAARALETYQRAQSILPTREVRDRIRALEGQP